jgi:hypothetical protein
MNLYEIDFAVLGLIQLQAASKEEAEQLAHDELAFLEAEIANGSIQFGNCQLLVARIDAVRQHRCHLAARTAGNSWSLERRDCLRDAPFPDAPTVGVVVWRSITKGELK